MGECRMGCSICDKVSHAVSRVGSVAEILRSSKYCGIRSCNTSKGTSDPSATNNHYSVIKNSGKIYLCNHCNYDLWLTEQEINQPISSLTWANCTEQQLWYREGFVVDNMVVQKYCLRNCITVIWVLWCHWKHLPSANHPGIGKLIILQRNEGKTLQYFQPNSQGRGCYYLAQNVSPPVA